ncbi:MAG TPA: tRNA (adenosine(37)-N6)-threonylcarbamoyltransferase complex dimerization subunit type 1 TsaB [bacterium]|jgi:tRNA threonylcarbamoyl adenosine modification protein YeaZ|nr:tRNA (adenosine(37)-N6)-threonylcarbamoyltransferase complex dimerization subunit type 1 TsaB [bacterium]HQB26231.1 tRNA (adenosine(37)-N6)-threonylcarbamoyltransferase complex dimerization subunit type 1 TsaB [bacterium]
MIMGKYTLFIDTVSRPGVLLALKREGDIVAQDFYPGNREQAETLLPSIKQLLADADLKLSNLERIEVVNHGGSFTSLRLGVVIANALGYALGVPVRGTTGQPFLASGYQIVVPEYISEPNITLRDKTC